MEWGILLLVLLVLACPVSMMWMMRRRGAKGETAHGHDSNGDAAGGDTTPAADLTDTLSEIERRQAVERGVSAMEAERRSPERR